MAHESIAEQEAEIAAIVALSRTRALTDAESDRLYLLLNRQRGRNYRIEERARAERLAARRIEALAA